MGHVQTLHLQDGTEITRDVFALASVLQLIESARAYRFIEGGPTIDSDRVYAIVSAGERAGWPGPTDEEIAAVIRSIDHAAAGAVR